jgi:hypothetical protein
VNVSEDDFAIFHELLTDGTADQTDEVTLQPITSANHDKIRQIVDANYAKTVQNTMRKNNKKVSRGNDSIVKGSFVTVRILTVDSASGDLPRILGQQSRPSIAHEKWQSHLQTQSPADMICDHLPHTVHYHNPYVVV